MPWRRERHAQSFSRHGSLSRTILARHSRALHHLCADQLQARLPGDLRARVEERVFVEPALGAARSVYPDIRVVERGRGACHSDPQRAGPAVAEPLVIYLSDEPVTERYIDIIDVGSGRRVVTVIEMLSLSNKLPGEGQELYRRKQRELRDGRVNLVEIDFLRVGDRVLAVGASRIPSLTSDPVPGLRLSCCRCSSLLRDLPCTSPRTSADHQTPPTRNRR